MVKYICDHCKTSFTLISNLTRHQKGAKYCLQGRKIEKDYCICPCGKQLSRNDVLERHQKRCAYYQKQTQKELQPTNDGNVQVKDLIQLITKLVERPTVTQTNNNNNNLVLNNLEPITDEDLQKNLDHLTINFINDGAKGYATFADSYPCKNRLLCTDKARKKLRYKDGDGELIDDASGLKLTQRFFQAIAPRNEELINAEYRALHIEVQKIAREGTAHTSNLTDLLTKATHLQELLVKCQQAAKGEENELTKEFVNHLSKML